MTRVVHIRSSAGFYGAERVLVNLLPKLGGFRVDSLLVAIENSTRSSADFVERARAAEISVSELPCHGKWRSRSQQQLNEEILRFGAQCIHTHDYKSHLFGYLAARRGNIPLVATLHGWTRETVKLKMYELVERFLLRRFDAIVVVSEGMAQDLRKRGFPDAMLQTIENGVDTEQFSPDNAAADRAEFGFGPGDYVFGVIGRLSREKGQEVLLKAFARVLADHPHVRLLLVGDGPEKPALLALAAELGIAGSVVFAGLRNDIEQILPAIDCCVSPSWTEGMPMTILEAMACQRPIIATEVGSVGKLLQGGAGFLVEPGDIAAMAALMSAVAAGGRETDTVAAVARKRCVEKYDTVSQAGSYARLYGSVCGTGA